MHAFSFHIAKQWGIQVDMLDGQFDAEIVYS